jgi:hypothetical protein
MKRETNQVPVILFVTCRGQSPWCACAVQVPSLEVVVQKHDPWWNPTRRNHTGWDLGNVVANASQRTRSTASCSVDGRPVDVRLQMQPVSWNYKYHFRIHLPLCESFPDFVRKCRWMLTTDLFTWKPRTQNDLCSPLVAIFLSWLLVDDSGTNAGKINVENLPSKAHTHNKIHSLVFA